MAIPRYSHEQSMQHPLAQQGSAIDAVLNVKTTLYAFNNMLAVLLEENTTIDPETGRGIGSFLEQQCFQLNGIAEAMIDRAFQKERDAQVSEAAQKLRREFIASGNKAGADADTISAAINVPPADIERVLRQLRGEASAHTAAQGGRAVAVSRRASAQA